ncbi:Metallopeptidase [uncultured virus]|nr:Metallopeptidase [uncultured virus]
MKKIKKNLFLISLVGYLFGTFLFNYMNYKEITLNELKEKTLIDNNFCEKILIDEINNKAYIFLNNKTEGNLYVKISTSGIVTRQINQIFKNNKNVIIEYKAGKYINEYIFDVIFYICLIYFGFSFLFKLSHMFDKNSFEDNFLGNDANFFNLANNINVKFSNVVGHNEAKNDLQECINFFKYPSIYDQIGYKIPKGIIFTGHPGTGKTLLAKAFAGETGINFISVSGSDFIEIFVGMGSKRVRDLFKFARTKSPCIIFIDEIDAIGRKRDKHEGGHNEHGSTLNKLLVEIDGFTNNDNIMVIGATNMPDVLDSALLRRFEKEIIFELPNKEERQELFELFIKKLKMSDDFNNNKEKFIKKLAELTAGLTGSDISNIANQSAANFMKKLNISNQLKDLDLFQIQLDNKVGINFEDLENSIDMVSIGMEKKERKLSDEEKHIVSIHECGHALVSYILIGTAPPIKVSIIPRGRNALGFTQQEPNDKKIYTKNELIAKVSVLFAGRIAEEINFGILSTGAQDDFEKATEIISKMITKYGMGKNGTINYTNKNKNNIKYSEKTKKEIDDEIKFFTDSIYNQTKELLSKNYHFLQRLSDHLLQKEQINIDEIDALLLNYNIKNSFLIEIE